MVNDRRPWPTECNCAVIIAPLMPPLLWLFLLLQLITESALELPSPCHPRRDKVKNDSDFLSDSTGFVWIFLSVLKVAQKTPAWHQQLHFGAQRGSTVAQSGLSRGSKWLDSGF